jgi:hypothetical protein
MLYNDDPPDVGQLTALLQSGTRSWTGEAAPPAHVIREQVQEILSGARAYWSCFTQGLITTDELRNALLARLQTWVERETGLPAPHPDDWVSPQLEGDLDAVLFRPREQDSAQ